MFEMIWKETEMVYSKDAGSLPLSIQYSVVSLVIPLMNEWSAMVNY